MNHQQVIDQMVLNFQLAQDAPNIAYNKGLMIAFRDNLAINNRGGPRMFDPDNIESFEHAIACRDQYILLYGESPHLPIGNNPLSPFFPTWRASVNVPPPAPIVLNDDQIADQLVNEYVARFPNILSFTTNNPDRLAPGYALLLQQHIEQRTVVASVPRLTSNDFMSRLHFRSQMEVTYQQGSSVPLMDAIEDSELFSLLSSMITVYREYLGEYVETHPRLIPERTFIKFFLLYCKIVSAADKKAVLKHFKSSRMSNESSEAFYEYDGKFLLNKNVMKAALLDQTPKSMSKLHASGLIGYARSLALPLTELVSSDFYSQYLDPLKKEIESYKDTEEHMANQAKKAAANVPSTIKSDGKATKKANAAAKAAATAVAAAASTAVVPTAAAAPAPEKSAKAAAKPPISSTCKNCNAVGHHMYSCKEQCQLSRCPRKIDIEQSGESEWEEHRPNYCPYRQLVGQKEFEEYLRVKPFCYPAIPSRYSSKKSISSPIPTSTHVVLSHPTPSVWPLAPQIQYDAGSNVLVAPSSPFNLPVGPPSIEDSIEVADGSMQLVNSVATLGTTSCSIAPSMPTMLVPQSFVENSDLFTILINKQLLLIDSKKTTQLKKLIANLKPVVCVNSSNGLYYLSADQLKFMADRQLENLPLLNSPNVSSSNSITQKSTSIAKYHTISFPKIIDLVVFWHRNLNHLSESKMISVVQNSLIDHLPAQLTVENIRKFFPKFPSPCFECPLGNLQRLSSPPSATHNFSIPIGAHWILDFAKFSGADDSKKVLAYGGGFTHFAFAIDYQSGRVYGYGTRGCSGDVVIALIKNLNSFNTGKSYTMRSMTVDKQYVTKKVTAYLNDATIHPNVIQLVLSERLEGIETLTSSSPNIIIQNVAIPYEHFGTGSVERLIRTCRETNWKKT